jgi:hypothetical protein
MNIKLPFAEILLAASLIATAGCSTNKVMVLTPNPETGKYETKFMTEFEAFQMREEAGFQRELRGEHPDGGFKTWESYWQNSYMNIRTSSKNSEKEIGWIKQRRQELGLPLYE